MATQTGIIIEGANQPHKVVDNIPRPSPEGRQVLVKCLAVGLNPIVGLQHHSGMMVNEWPAILGSDGGGVVIEVGPDVARLDVGDYVYSCAPVGQNRFTPFQDAYLAQEDLLFKLGDNISLEDSCTIGACLLTSTLCLLGGAGLEVPTDGNKAEEKDEWIVILGGSGNVGQFAIQLGKVCGYKVLASCSPSKQSIAVRNGASATFNSRETIDAQVAEIKITNGKFGKMMDASTYGYVVMVKALESASNAKEKYLTSVDSCRSPFSTPSSINEYRADLGHLCRPNERDGTQITASIANWIPLLEKHIAAGTLKPLEHHVVDGVGWEKVIQGIQDMENGKFGKKIVVRTQQE
ncbi:zinc-binding alcohol dehydrogenase domain-containing protein [Fusarium napiforme]|uniref:Zinc-binding alcohol dehydrogenase domain-containing protein n=1 Tax=Fusarium napiforme TaxID=42672 RepID=A0A8H5J9E9_9HYPO|nr:zinc-binding alcohol dehydrogenase domain-containing protein [Fusarium napiforme]